MSASPARGARIRRPAGGAASSATTATSSRITSCLNSRKELGIPVDELANEIKLIRQLDPYPGRKYAPRKAQYIEPEVYIEKIEDEYLIRFNDDGLPQLRINRSTGE